MFSDQVGDVLAARGHVIASRGMARQVLFPYDEHPPQGAEGQRFYSLSSSLKFRLMVRDLILGDGAAATMSGLTSIAGAKTEGYVAALVALNLAAHESNGDVRLTRRLGGQVGPTLEWHVAQVCLRELRGDVAWGVKLREISIGGDFDVIAWLPPALAYIELKSASPERVSGGELRWFLQRNVELAPDLAILLIDRDKPVAPALAACRRESAAADPASDTLRSAGTDMGMSMRETDEPPLHAG